MAEQPEADSRSLAEILQEALIKAKPEPLDAIHDAVKMLGADIQDAYRRWVDQALEFNGAAERRADKIVGAIHALTWVVGVFGLIFLIK